MTLTKAQIVKSVQNQTGEDMMLEPRKVVTFKCSGGLRKRVNGR
jgi:nucleoid DNA-binding protein